MKPVYGIDLGTTFSSAAEVAEVGSFTAAPMSVENGQRSSLASEVLLTRDSRDRVIAYVGEEARKRYIDLGPEKSTLALHAKRGIGVEATDDRRRTWYLDDEEFDAIDISALVLKKLKKTIERETGDDLGPAIVTHPRDFKLAQKHATEQAAKAVGIDLIDTLDEPVAGLYAFQEPGATMLGGSYMIFDLGGGTLDIAIMEVGGESPRVIGGHGVPRLGGVDWDLDMVQMMMNAADAKLPTEAPIETKLSPHSILEIHRWANRWKHQQNRNLHSKLFELRFVDGRVEPVVLDVDRRAWEWQADARVTRCLEAIDEALTAAGRSDDEIVQVVPIGGSTRLQTIQNMLRGRFGSRVIGSDELAAGVDLAVAVGAARYASYRVATDPRFADRRRGRTPTLRIARSSIATTSMPHGINILLEDEDGSFVLAPLVQQGASLPVVETRTYEVASGGHGLEVALFEGEPGPLHPSWRAQYTIQLPEDLEAREGDPVQVHVDVGQSGRVERVRVEHLPSGVSKDVALKSPDRELDEVALLEARRARLAEIEVF